MPKPPAAKKAGQSKLLNIEFYLEAARTHGEDSEPDHEVGDLQDFLRVAWSLLTPAQRVQFAKSTEVYSTLEGALPSFDADRELAKLS